MSEAVAAPISDVGAIDLRNLIWVALALAVLIVAIVANNIWALNFLHVMCGVLWTGIDLFMGFVVGPIIRRLPFEARRAVIVKLLPKTLFLMPTLAIVTGTAGWYHARQLGFLDLPWPQYGWVLAALIIVVISPCKASACCCRPICWPISRCASRRRICRASAASWAATFTPPLSRA